MKATLRVVMHDSYGTCMSLQHENEWMPHRRRLVSIELTPEQCAQLEPRHLGTSTSGSVTHEWHEEIGESWLETEPTPKETP